MCDVSEARDTEHPLRGPGLDEDEDEFKTGRNRERTPEFSREGEFPSSPTLAPKAAESLSTKVPNLLSFLNAVQYREFESSDEDRSIQVSPSEETATSTSDGGGELEGRHLYSSAEDFTCGTVHSRRCGRVIMFNHLDDLELNGLPSAPRVRDRGILFLRMPRGELPTCGTHHFISRFRGAAAYMFRRLRCFRPQFSWSNRAVCMSGRVLLRADMRVLMEDARLQQRDAMVEASVSLLHRKSLRMKRRNNRHPSLRLASRVLTKVYVCSSCSSPLFNAHDVRRGRDQERVRVTLEDSDTICFGSRRDNVFTLSDPHTLQQSPWRSESIYYRSVSCRRCGIFLGVRVDAYASPDDVVPGIGPEPGYANHMSVASRFHMSQNGMTIVPMLPRSRPRNRTDSTVGNAEENPEEEEVEVESEDRSASSASQSDIESHIARFFDDSNTTFRSERDLAIRSTPPRHARARSLSGDQGTTRVDRYFLGTRYVRIQMARTGSDVTNRVPVRCFTCARTLTFTDQLLCCERRWSFEANTTPESACYVNGVVEENIRIDDAPYMERLAQGPFEMADVSCVCGERVGYKFVRDHSPSLRNEHQQGRYGLVLSRVTVRVA